MYRVIKYFTDLQDNNFAYQVGDVFPHDGKEVDDARLEELSTNKNRRGEPMIEKVVDEVKAEAAEPVEDFMNPPVVSDEGEVVEKPKKKRGRPRNDE